MVSGLIANITKPVIIYRACFDKGAGEYFLDTLKYLASMAVILVVCNYISGFVLRNLNYGTIVLMALIITVIFNGTYFVLYGRTAEFKYLFGKIKEKVVRN